MKSPEDPGKKSFNIGMIIIAILGMAYIIAMIIVSRPKPTHNVTDRNRVDTVERSIYYPMHFRYKGKAVPFTGYFTKTYTTYK